MPLRLIDTDCSPLVIDHEYEVSDPTLLAQYVGDMLLGHHRHVRSIPNGLTSSRQPVAVNQSIDNIIDQLNSSTPEKRDGWFFQMMSWIVINYSNITSW